MSTWWQVVLGALAGLVVIWLAVVTYLYRIGRAEAEPTRMRDVLRLLPDVIRLSRRLAVDPTLPRGVRLRLVLLVGYLLLPVDVVPDFVPVIGYADDAIVVALTLRSVARRAGTAALDKHWPGTSDGLRAVKQLAGVQEGHPLGPQK